MKFKKSWEQKHYNTDISYRIDTSSWIKLKEEKELNTCNNIIKHFSKGKELLFEFYREDGINLTEDEFLKYKKEIPEYFKKHGKILVIDDIRTIACLPINERIYEIFPKIFNYYLETSFFVPRIDWESFVHQYHENVKNRKLNFIENNYTDVILRYVDSGIFMIEFNFNVYDKDKLYDEITKIASE